MGISPRLDDPTHHWTVEEVLALPEDGNRYEVVEGELLVSPAPRQVHQAVARDLFVVLQRYLESTKLHHTIFWHGDITWSRDTLVQPDIFVGRPNEITGDWRSMRWLRLAVEILSPSSIKADRWTKRLAYQKYGVEHYWIVDSKAASIEVWHPSSTAPAVAIEQLRWCVTPESPELTLDVAALFAPYRAL